EESKQARVSLVGVAVHQLIHRNTDEGDPGLLRLLLEIAARPGDRKLREAAMAIYEDRAPGGMRLFPLKRESVERAFGSFSEFVALLPGMLGEAPLTTQSRTLDFLSELFANPEPGDADLIAAEGEAGRALIRAILTRIGAETRETGQTNLRRQLLRYLSGIRADESWRDEVVEALDCF